LRTSQAFVGELCHIVQANNSYNGIQRSAIGGAREHYGFLPEPHAHTGRRWQSSEQTTVETTTTTTTPCSRRILADDRPDASFQAATLCEHEKIAAQILQSLSLTNDLIIITIIIAPSRRPTLITILESEPRNAMARHDESEATFCLLRKLVSGGDVDADGAPKERIGLFCLGTSVAFPHFRIPSVVVATYRRRLAQPCAL
jgi:hypothetical protein